MLSLFGVFCLALAGCETLRSNDVQVVQARTQELCDFVPTAITVAEMLAVASSGVAPGGIIVSQGVRPIAEAICRVVTSRPNTLIGDAPCPKVNGVCVMGVWQKP